MNRYIIKNCSNYDECGCRCTTDCLLKQIVEKCKETEKYYSECLEKNRETFYQYMDEENLTWLMGRSSMAGDILRMFEIEECEDD